MKTTSSNRGMKTSPQPQSEPDSTQRPARSSALASSAMRSSRGRISRNFGCVGSQKKSSVSRCVFPRRSATAAASVVVPEPEAPRMCTREALVLNQLNLSRNHGVGLYAGPQEGPDGQLREVAVTDPRRTPGVGVEAERPDAAGP